MDVRLRSLNMEDLQYMKELIEDEDIADNFKFTRYPYNIDAMKLFIENSWKDKFNVHFAIVNDLDEYLGTVSLKNINYIDRNAEYAIITRKKAWGTGVSKIATEKIIEYAFNKLNLRKVYLNVLSSNVRAIKFYEKFGFQREGVFKKHIYVKGKYEDLIWYAIVK